MNLCLRESQRRPYWVVWSPKYVPCRFFFFLVSWSLYLWSFYSTSFFISVTFFVIHTQLLTWGLWQSDHYTLILLHLLILWEILRNSDKNGHIARLLWFLIKHLGLCHQIRSAPMLWKSTHWYITGCQSSGRRQLIMISYANDSPNRYSGATHYDSWHDSRIFWPLHHHASLIFRQASSSQSHTNTVLLMRNQN